jgi:alpha-glucosidase
MKLPAPPPRSELAGLRPVATAPAAFTLASRDLIVEATALAPDLIRLRIARGEQFSGHPSWAVDKVQWPEVPARVRVSARTATLQTSDGYLQLDLKTGAWKVMDSAGLELFSAARGATVFTGGQANLTLKLTENESLFGLGEATGQFNRRGLVREFWNIDVLGHAPAIHPGLKSLYVSIPFAVSLREGRAAGLFWDNPAKQTWDLGQTKLGQWQMTAASGELDLYLFLGPTVEGVVSRYTDLTGHMPLPPLWGLGYQQCRYGYETRARVEEIAREFRRRELPCDVLYLDIHHMDGYRVFTFGKKFPKPAQLMAKLAKQGFKVVTIVDPGVKDDPKFGVLKRGVKADAFVKDAGGKKDFIGEVWPGKARFPDFMNPATRVWWGEEQKRLLDAGVAGFWNDMNEPANFARPDKTLSPDALHRTDQGPRRHHEVHNLYGMQMARASREGGLRHGGLAERGVKRMGGPPSPRPSPPGRGGNAVSTRDSKSRPSSSAAAAKLVRTDDAAVTSEVLAQPFASPSPGGEGRGEGGRSLDSVPRPFVITRAGYAGIQRHALVWTGDNSSNWDHLNDSVQMFLNLSLSGVPFCGGDVGGFLENTTPELFARWFQFAAFTPFFRNHSNLGTIDQEPWAFGPEVESLCRTYLGLRYQLLPYLYCLFAEARATGAPIMRPLLWHYQNDPVAVACGDQFLLGRDLLVAPVLRQGAVARSVYLPNDLWYDFWTGEKIQGGDHIVAEAPFDVIPLFVRAGAILPLAEPQQFVGQKPMDTISLNLWPHGRGELAWYEDDGATQAYETGAWSRRAIRSSTKGRTLKLEFGAAAGEFASRIENWRLTVWGAKKPSRLKVNGRPAEGSFNADGEVFLADVRNVSGEFNVEFIGV